jgi:hypothetical protein
MADLNIPNLNLKSDKYIFKKKLSLKRKSKKRLFIESVFMFSLSLFLVYLNYLIPNKYELIVNIPSALKKSLFLSIEILRNIYDVVLVLFIFSSSVAILILLIGSFYRIFRIANRKTKQINFN